MQRDALAIGLWPLALWRAQLAAWSAMVGAAEVIAARVPLIGQAMVDPLSADHRELTVMVSEKVDALGVAQRRAQQVGAAVVRTMKIRLGMAETIAQGRWPGPEAWLAQARADLAAGAALAGWPGATVDPFARRVRANARRLRVKGSGRLR